ncbi:MAG TPA: PQQ-binding-like beta-propeller repeat protein [Candidatus Fimenecus excrementigallinarum]|uniref:PQQ-binding-like beta-propeller repeat protein n=1 Tax=Candidatus Fimenecus excrementigallinarum TaxID=2840816 RepID=A0A9D1LEJ5_9FIRM|nr:PQQ-binding-like beta-propeller repeat protein [Candidatus Fimenecus excrementigallinarum]
MSKKKLIILCVALAVLLIVGLTLYFTLRGGGPYTGRVTLAATGEGLAGVSVSDGRNVTKTAEDGSFTLPGYRKTRFITVTAPAGYWTEDYYIPVSGGTESYDFALDVSEIPAGAAHTFLQISDTEIGENGVGEWIDHVKGLADELQPAFLVHTGDICYEAGLKRHIEDMNTENMGLPVRYLLGNHDYVDGKYGEALFESLYGPTWYSFEVGNVHYVVTPFGPGGDEKSGYNKNDRWRWLENDLQNTDPDMKVVMFNHTKSPSENYVLEFDRKTLDLKAHNLIAWVYGHYHYNYVQENDGVLNISTARPDCGGIDSSASGTRLISIAEDGTVSTRMYYYNLPETPATVENAAFAAQLEGNVLFCDTVLDGGRVYTATVDDDWPRRCGVYCLDANSGAVVWFYETVNSVKNNVVVRDGRVYAQDCEGYVYCLDAESGEPVWHKQVKLSTGLSTANGIALDGGVLYTGCAAGVTALSAETGEVVWENLRGRGEGSPAEFVVMGDKLLVSSHWDALVALDKATGKELWKNSDEDVRFRSSTPVAADDATILVADDDAVVLLDAATGEIKQKTVLEDKSLSSSAQPVLADGTAYIPASDSGLLAVSVSDGSVLWQTKVGGAMVFTAPYTNDGAETIESTPVLLDGQLWFGASDGKIYCVNAADGSVVQAYAVGAPVFGKLAVTGDGVWGADFSGRVFRLAR